jgi:hypothetical protein
VAIAASALVTALRMRQVIADFNAGPKSAWRKCGAARCSVHSDVLERRIWTPSEVLTVPGLLPHCRLLAANIFDLFFTRGFSEKCYFSPVGFFFHEEGSPLPAKIF